MKITKCFARYQIESLEVVMCDIWTYCISRVILGNWIITMAISFDSITPDTWTSLLFFQPGSTTTVKDYESTVSNTPRTGERAPKGKGPWTIRHYETKPTSFAAEPETTRRKYLWEHGKQKKYYSRDTHPSILIISLYISTWS